MLLFLDFLLVWAVAGIMFIAADETHFTLFVLGFGYPSLPSSWLIFA
jgi:hypothetical protein